MIYCPACNIAYPVGNRYCNICRSNLIYTESGKGKGIRVRCEQCGQLSPIESENCKSCEARIPQEILFSNEQFLTDTTTITPPVSNFVEVKPKKKKVGKKGSGKKKQRRGNIESLTCPKCSKDILTDFDICPYCGTRLKQDKDIDTSETRFGMVVDENSESVIEPDDQPEELPPGVDASDKWDKQTSWPTTLCQICHHITRVDTGFCRYCNAALDVDTSGKPLQNNSFLEQWEAIKNNNKPQEEKTSTISSQIPPDVKKEKTSSPPTVQIPVSTPVPQTTTPLPKRKPVLMMVVVVLGIFLLFDLAILLVFWHHTGKKSTPITSMMPSIPFTTSPTVSNDTESIMALVETLQKATIAKDADLYVSAFSSKYPDLEEKKKSMIAVFKTVEFTNLSYSTAEEGPLTIEEEKANIMITWNMSLRKLPNKRIIQLKEKDLMRFEKEDGAWKITENSPR